MQYRMLPHGGEQISVLGLGTSTMGQAGAKEVEALLDEALSQEINYFDLAAGDAVPFEVFGRACASVRKQVRFQLHFGAEYSTGQYGWTTDLETIKKSVDWQLTQLKTDYIDFGFIHCIDEMADLKKVEPVITYIIELKRQGVVRHIGLSTHTPQVGQALLDRGILDMMMFSINPAYDYRYGEFASGSAEIRRALYRRCETEGVGISVMKPFCGGQLLSAKASPFPFALTPAQLLQYALDQPGVITVLPGVRDRKELRDVLSYLEASPQERDYAVLGTAAPTEIAGVCVYCNHCMPCPAELEIGLINKYYDLAKEGDTLAADHYAHLAHTASACRQCGHCNQRCPFKVDQMARMAEIAAYFGD